MTLTPAQIKVLEYLSGASKSTATLIGCYTLRTTRMSKPQSYARPAGAILKKLRELDYVSWRYKKYAKIWEITESGRDALSALKNGHLK